MTGISLQRHGIALARVTRTADEGALRLDYCSYQPLSREKGEEAVLKEFSQHHDLESTPCVSVIPDNQFNLLLVEAPEVDSTELRSAVRWRIKDLIDFHIDDAVIDVFDIPRQEERGRAKMMYVVASRITTVKSHIERLEGHDINLSAIDIPELVQRNIAELLPEDHTGVALLTLSGNSGLLTLTRDGNLYLARTLELGVEQLAVEMDHAAKPDEDDENGLSVEQPEVQGIPLGVARLLDSVILEIQRSMDYYESHFSLPPISGLVVAPMERNVPGVVSYLASNLGLPVRQLDLNSVLESEQTIDDRTQAHCLSAIGAALRHEEVVL